MGRYVLYAMPASLYSAKARAYLRKHGIDYVERAPGDARYREHVIPAVGRRILPVLETPDGALVQDTVDIIDHLERELPPGRSAYPEAPRQRVVAHLLELFGGEGLLRPAMHYRWDFDETNLPFLYEDFVGALALGGDEAARDAAWEASSGRMRKATVAVGVTPELVPEVERSYDEFLALLDAHLETAPYLLGGRPTIADFGFAGPLCAHLARDPYPSALMKRRAQRVWRWTERMNAPVLDASEYGDVSEQLFPGDDVPPTLRRLLAYVGEEYCAEATATVAALDRWLEANPETAEGDVVGGKPSRRAIGTATTEWRGKPLTVNLVPYRVFQLQRLQAAYAAADAQAQADVRRLFSESGLESLLDVRPRRRVERRENREVWGAEQTPLLGSPPDR